MNRLFVIVILSFLVASTMGKPNCPENSIFTPCGPACPLTCEDLVEKVDPKTRGCIQVCIEGCECNKGFALFENKCVKQETCSQLVKKSE
ncbi:unnamed protein product [Bursaphelenchus xylophilus]|uniref:(pine wood nematode) hypothetical protein n=1 Tax=Bursaphelenchus xylophilus TaxID=6326 RepID=A0A1I7S0D7_BURXY|nr:unnamed protein product [Bursaphelenchus xylophilus]CAG9132220.1 unnamed protein product [Bursaphelenchus xylophilus]